MPHLLENTAASSPTTPDSELHQFIISEVEKNSSKNTVEAWNAALFAAEICTYVVAPESGQLRGDEEISFILCECGMSQLFSDEPESPYLAVFTSEARAKASLSACIKEPRSDLGILHVPFGAFLEASINAKTRLVINPFSRHIAVFSPLERMSLLGAKLENAKPQTARTNTSSGMVALFDPTFITPIQSIPAALSDERDPNWSEQIRSGQLLILKPGESGAVAVEISIRPTPMIIDTSAAPPRKYRIESREGRLFFGAIDAIPTANQPFDERKNPGTWIAVPPGQYDCVVSDLPNVKQADANQVVATIRVTLHPLKVFA